MSNCLDLLEKCFKSTIANGFSVLIPYQDPPTYKSPNVNGEDNAMHGETQFHEGGANDYQGGNEDVNEEPPNVIMPSPSNVNAKRKMAGKRDKI